MTMRKDPERLAPAHDPALVQFRDGEALLVAHQYALDNGWLRCLTWDGKRPKFPPERIERVEPVETTRVSDGDRSWQELDDVELRERARELAGLDECNRRAVADGGERP
jgi:hypothetical protein